MKVDARACGRSALLLEPADPDAVLALAAALRDEPDVDEIVPAARTVLVRCPPDRVAALRARVAALDPADVAAPEGDEVLLDVRYDGADLAATAAEVGLDVDALVQAHAGARYRVAFCGFAPGFAYLTGLEPRLHVPRLAEPRTRVPAGSVAVAGAFSGVYPRESAGGWRLLGRTDAALWDLTRDSPALLTPGTRVRFRAC